MLDPGTIGSTTVATGADAGSSAAFRARRSWVRRLRLLRAGSFVIVASVLLASACSSDSTGGPPSSGPVSLTGSSSAGQGVVLEGAVLGGGVYPTYTVRAPDGWASDGHFITSGPGVLGLSVWDVGKVPQDPCRWKQQLRDPGPTTSDLVDALESQRYRDASAPSVATLAGHSGTYVKWSVPSWVVTGDSDFKGCGDPGNGHEDFVSWFGTGGKGERYQQVAGQVDRLWILHVNGQRLIVDATYSPDTSQAARTELGNIAQSLQFAKSPS